MTRPVGLSHSDPIIRLAGLTLILIGYLAGRHLYDAVHPANGHGPPPLELLWGAVAYLGIATGMGFACLGAHIHDEVPISERWRPRLSAKGKPLPEALDDEFWSRIRRIGEGPGSVGT